MKLKELINLLSFEKIVKIAIISSLGFSIFFVVIGSILLLMGASAPITWNGEHISGLKGFLMLLALLPFYLLLIFLMQLAILSIGLWISKRLFFLKR